MAEDESLVGGEQISLLCVDVRGKLCSTAELV